MKRVLIVDALNMYLRSYIINPTLSSNGSPVGGTVGTLQSLNKLARETKPDRIIICWDGSGGSQKRKSVNKNYKEGRKPIRLNRAIRNLSESEEMANKIWQQTRLLSISTKCPSFRSSPMGLRQTTLFHMLPDTQSTRVGKSYY